MRIKWYINKWYEIIFRPILFYTLLKKEDWKEDPLTFAAYSSWISAFFLTLGIFITQYIPIGKYLIEGLSNVELIIVLPVILTISFVFFTMTFVIVGGIFMGVIIFFLYFFAIIAHYILKLFKGIGDIKDMISAYLYSSAVFVSIAILSILMILTKWHYLTFWQFRMSENVIYYFSCIYIYGLWSIAGKKVHDVPRWKAFLSAVIPALILILINIVLDKKVFPKFENLFI